MKKLTTISATQLRVEDVAHARGGVFRIESMCDARTMIGGLYAYGDYDVSIGPSPVAVPKAIFIGGEPIPGAFRPEQILSFSR
jgi:hypothetical protein